MFKLWSKCSTFSSLSCALIRSLCLRAFMGKACFILIAWYFYNASLYGLAINYKRIFILFENTIKDTWRTVPLKTKRKFWSSMLKKLVISGEHFLHYQERHSGCGDKFLTYPVFRFMRVRCTRIIWKDCLYLSRRIQNTSTQRKVRWRSDPSGSCQQGIAISGASILEILSHFFMFQWGFKDLGGSGTREARPRGGSWHRKNTPRLVMIRLKKKSRLDTREDEIMKVTNEFIGLNS